jgi:ligand-binding SRPBCC domain-containing protein
MHVDTLMAATPIRFEYRSTFDAPVGRLWRFYMAPAALERLTPPLIPFRVVNAGSGRVADGSVVGATVGRWPLRSRWTALHAAVRAEESFVDIALESPFRYWVHLHQFEAEGDSRSRLIDVIWFLPPACIPRAIGRLLAVMLLRPRFWWRHRITRKGLSEPAVGRRCRTQRLRSEAGPGGRP